MAWVNRVLFLMERYCDADPKCGPTNSECTLVAAVKSTGLVGESKRFYFDALCQQVGRAKMAQLLVQDCEMFEPDIVIYSPLGGPLGQLLNPPNEAIETIRSRGIKVYTHLWDTVGSDEHVSVSHVPFADLTGIVDSIAGRWKDPRVIQAYPAVAPETFYDKKLQRDIDVSFVGALDSTGVRWPNRIRYINFLQANGVPVVVAGGQRQNRLSWEEYAAYFQRSKISLNFSIDPPSGTSQHKARIFEAMACGSLLVEDSGEHTKRLFEPNSDYVMFERPGDLLQKVCYYLAHDDEREAIARSGWEKVTNIYNSRNMWGYIFEKMGFETPEWLAQDENYRIHKEKMEWLGSTWLIK